VHYEAIQVHFDPSQVTYEQLLDIFWRQIDPTDIGGQFADRGGSYKTAIFYHSEEQRQLAQVSKSKLEKSGIYDKPIVTEIIAATTFYPAEEYHQEYFKKEPAHYAAYKYGSGRQTFLEQKWKDVD
jgi:methionine-S-sulfoxide reductase